MAHPIRPESYIAMDNFYTSTVYEKGAEVIRMYEALLGREGFRKGNKSRSPKLKFQRHVLTSAIIPWNSANSDRVPFPLISNLAETSLKFHSNSDEC